ncbi:MAG: GNAT family N-acetyltransferase [Bacteroidales bacterium]
MTYMQPLYQIVKSQTSLQKVYFIRGIVFCEEQGIAYDEEMDGFDDEATHILVSIDHEPVGAARLRFIEDYAKMERISVRRCYRSRGIGGELIKFMLHYLHTKQCPQVKMHAQAHLQRFYQDFGFIVQGEKFMEAGIAHYAMAKTLLTIE